LAGFIQADGHFGCAIRTAKDMILGKQVQVFIEIVQHNRSAIVLNQIQSFLGMGTIYLKNNSINHLKIQGLKNVNLFINKFPADKLYGTKKLDYLAFCQIVDLMNNNKHLTTEGLAQIEEIVNTMNAKRSNFE
jgi:hypothetical protein